MVNLLKQPVRVLIVVPDQAGIDVIPEIRDISSYSNCQVTVLNGIVTKRDVFAHARDGYDAIHYASHGDENGVMLSNNECLTPQDTATINRIAAAKISFFNACLSGKPASYLVANGGFWAIYGNVAVEDSIAWKFPLTFYRALKGVGIKEVTEALLVADSRTGEYGHTISLEALLEWYRDTRYGTFRFSRWQLILIGSAVAVSLVLTGVFAFLF